MSGKPIRSDVIDKSSSTLNSAGATALMAKNLARNYLFIQNIDTVSMWISFTGTAAANTAGSFELKPASSITIEGNVVPTNAISIIPESGGAGKKVTAYEG